MYEAMVEAYDRIFPFNPAVVVFLTRRLSRVPARILDIGAGPANIPRRLPGSISRRVSTRTRRRSPGRAQPIPTCRFTSAIWRDSIPRIPMIWCIASETRSPTSFLLNWRPSLQVCTGSCGPGGAWVFHTLNWDRILSLESYPFPVIAREGLRFARVYRDIGPDQVSFDTLLEDEKGVVCENRIPLYPIRRDRIRELHAGFLEEAVYSDYAEKPFQAGDMSQVFVYRRP